VPTLLYYPAHAPLTTDGTYEGADGFMAAKYGVMDAEPDLSDAPYPVLVYSHGSGGQKEGQKYLLEYLASHGFVAIAPDHTGNVGPGQVTSDDPQIAVDRPLDIVFVLDQVLARFLTDLDPLAGLGNAGRVAMAGHSFGGYTTWMITGATPSWDDIAARCAAQPDAEWCAVLDARATLEAALPDPRIQVAVTLAAYGADDYFGPACAGAASVALPLLVVGGTADTWCPYETEAVPCYDQLPQPKYLLTLTDAGHVGFTDMADDGPMDLQRQHAIVQRYVVAFLETYLTGRRSLASYLDQATAARWNEGYGDFTLVGP